MPETHLIKLHQLFDESTGIWSDEYQADGIEGKPISAIVPRADHHPSAVYRALLAAGAALPPIENVRDRLLAAISASAPIVHRAASCGWRSDGRSFVSHRFVVQCDNPHASVQPPQGACQTIAAPLKLAGSLAEWQALVGVATYSTAMCVSLCAAFAAPLLSLLNRPSFGLVLVGPSRAGKSTAQLVGSSVIGFGTEEALPNLDATPAGLLSAALLFCDHLLPINEIATARGKKKDVYVVLRESTYSLMSGRDVMRHPSWTGAAAGTPTMFRVLPLLSSEHSPDDWAGRNGETRDDGETARLIGLPVVAEGHETILDDPPFDE